MATAYTTYYNLVRVRELGPEAKDWAATDTNFEAISLILKSFEQHSHTGAAGLATPTTTPSLTQFATGGSLSPGTMVGVRLSYVNALGLETDATTEVDVTLPAAVDEPLTPILGTVAAYTGGLSGGTYIYGITKTISSGAGETELSDVLPVTIDYDQTYSVNITFDSISSYSDGTTGLNIYRSAGLNSSFQLVGQISDVNQTSFTDENVSVDQTVQPPSTSTFDMTYKINIDWSALTYPSTAVGLNIYITQQTGIWGTESLLKTIDLTSSPPTNMDYLGSETLNSGYPLDATEIPDQPPQIDLGTMATGGFILTADSDFQQHQAKNMVIGTSSSTPASPVNGLIYYDTSLNNMRAYINGAWTNWGVAAGTVYTHPAEETGGHLATNIRWVTGSSTPNLSTMLGSLFNTAGARQQLTRVLSFTGPTPPSATTISSTTPSILDFISISSPEFNNQYYRITWQGNVVVGGAAFQSLTLELQIHGGSVLDGTTRTLALQANSSGFGDWFPFHISALVQVPTAGLRVDLVWFVSGSGATGTFNTHTYHWDVISLP